LLYASEYPFLSPLECLSLPRVQTQSFFCFCTLHVFSLRTVTNLSRFCTANPFFPPERELIVSVKSKSKVCLLCKSKEGLLILTVFTEQKALQSFLHLASDFFFVFPKSGCFLAPWRKSFSMPKRTFSLYFF